MGTLPHGNPCITGNMKKRIVSDIMMNRVLYPLVPVHEFTKDKLEAVFEQAYTTFRTKFSSQSSANLNDKDDGKAQKARRQSRKKTVSQVSSFYSFPIEHTVLEVSKSIIDTQAVVRIFCFIFRRRFPNGLYVFGGVERR